MLHHWNLEHNNPKPLVRWKDLLSGKWKGPDVLLTSGRGYACVFPQNADSPLWIPDRLIRHVQQPIKKLPAPDASDDEKEIATTAIPSTTAKESPPSSSASTPPPEDPLIDQLARLSLVGMSSQYHHKRPWLHQRPSQATQRGAKSSVSVISPWIIVKSRKIPVIAENHFLAILALLSCQDPDEEHQRGLSGTPFCSSKK